MSHLDKIFSRIRERHADCGPRTRASDELLIRAIKKMREKHMCLMSLPVEEAAKIQLVALRIEYMQGNVRRLNRDFTFSYKKQIL